MVFHKATTWVKQLYTARRRRFYVYAATAVIVFFYLIITIVQFSYGSDNALYGAKLGAETVQGQDREQLVKTATELYSRTEIRVTSGTSEIFSIVAPSIDKEFDANAVADEVTDYSFLERLIPFSLWLKKPSVTTTEVRMNPETAKMLLVDEFGESGDVAPVNAALVVDDQGRVTIVKEKQGAKIDTSEVSQLFETMRAPLGGAVTLTTDKALLTAPEVTAADLEADKQRIQAVIDRSVRLSFETETVQVEPRQLGEWVTFTYEGGAVRLGLNPEKLTPFLNESLGPKVTIAPGKSSVTLLDGNEVSRVDGPAGRAIDMRQTSERLIGVLNTESTETQTVAVQSTAVPPVVNYTRQYTKTLAGLQAYARHLGADYDIRLSVQQLGGAGWSAGARPTEQSVSASTYKLYVAVYVLQQIASGQAAYGDQINGMTTRACLEKMIVNSDNACAEAFLTKFDAKKVTDFFWAKGYSRGTSMYFSDGLARTTTADLNKILIELERGSILGGGERSLLLDLMGRQVYRSGVPSGTSAAVKDKVGFLSGYLNDAAIVSHPRGTYVISVITKGESWGKIAEITRQVESLMYP